MKFLFYILIVVSFTAFAQEQDTSAKKGPEVFTVVEEMPEFPGGTYEMMRFIQKNLKYPLDAKEKGMSGKVYLKFIVNESGNIADSIYVIKSTGYKILDNEAIRVVKSMPKWKPGTQNGKAVPVFFNIPINFQVYDNTTYSEAISLNDAEKLRNADYYYNAGVREYSAGNFDKAIYNYKEALKYRENDIDALYNLGATYYKKGDTKSSCETWKKVQQLGKTDCDILIKKHCTN